MGVYFNDKYLVINSRVVGEGNGTPLQYSCLENPMDGWAWWAAVHGSLRVGHDWSDLAAAAAAELYEDMVNTMKILCKTTQIVLLFIC